MPDPLGSLRQQLQQIESQALSTNKTVGGLTNTLQQLYQLQFESSGLKGAAEEKARIDNLISSVKGLRDAQKELTKDQETGRQVLERLVGSNKALVDVLDKITNKLGISGKAVEALSNSYKALTEKADIGRAVQQISSLSERFKFLGLVVGEAITAYIRFSDRVQISNKAVIDASASTGRFAEGLDLARESGAKISTGMFNFGMQVGISGEKIREYVGQLGELGFGFKEIGLDTTTGHINKLTDSIASQVDKWGALGAIISASRMTGIDMGNVLAQMQFQVKGLGDSVKGTVLTFASLSTAADRSKLSTQILLPILRSSQDAFKYLGFNSQDAARALGEAGAAAEKAGIGAGAAVEIAGKAMAGMARMDFGMMTFLGQQMGMGGGLTAGFGFRQQASQQKPGGMMVDIGRVISQTMGGTGEMITEEQARGNEDLAAIRLGQEQLAMQIFGMSQIDARAYTNLVIEMQKMRATGKEGTKEFAEINKKIKDAELTEGDYRARTLTAQEKMSRIMELISQLLGRTLITFVRAFAGGAAKGERDSVTGLLKQAMEAISKGEAIDKIGGNFADAMDKAFATNVDPVVESFAK